MASIVGFSTSKPTYIIELPGLSLMKNKQMIKSGLINQGLCVKYFTMFYNYSLIVCISVQIWMGFSWLYTQTTRWRQNATHQWTSYTWVSTHKLVVNDVIIRCTGCHCALSARTNWSWTNNMALKFHPSSYMMIKALLQRSPKKQLLL